MHVFLVAGWGGRPIALNTFPSASLTQRRFTNPGSNENSVTRNCSGEELKTRVKGQGIKALSE